MNDTTTVGHDPSNSQCNEQKLIINPRTVVRVQNSLVIILFVCSPIEDVNDPEPGETQTPSKKHSFGKKIGSHCFIILSILLRGSQR